MKHNALIRFLMAAFLMLTTATLVWGQSGQVTGRVSDSTGAVVPGAKITATNSGTGVSRESLSNDEGFYTIPLLPPGSCWRSGMRATAG